MILTLVGVKNFKSFKETARINLGNKFTLLYGNNSSGKSSILQAIDILKSSFSSPGQGIKYEGISRSRSYSRLICFYTNLVHTTNYLNAKTTYCHCRQT